eukprot:c20563_g1_i1.p1 GENE.c20563_g1_i1~~c20563_g1_i1.p1  ORF type:complete len:242 (-),score=71.99 c20563_g1_i1:45-770(-)
MTNKQISNLPLNLNKVTINLQKLEKGKSGRIPICIVLGGSFNPIHSEHIESFELARKYLRSYNYEVVGGFLGISSTSHVVGKVGAAATIKLKHRVESCDLACENSDIVVSVPWGWASASSIAAEIKDILEQRLNVNMLIFNMCGSDLILRYGRWGRSLPMICIARPPYIEEVKKKIAESPSDYSSNFFLIPESAKEVSSTQVRDLLFNSKWDELQNSKIIGENVLKFLKEKKQEMDLFEAS